MAPKPRRAAQHLRRWAALATAGALTLTGIGVGALPATAAPVISPVAAPAAPDDLAQPRLIWQEDFENGIAATDIVELPDYTGAAAVTYTAEPYWLSYDECNGLIVSHVAGEPSICYSADGRSNVRRLADTLGQLQLGVTGSAVKTTPVNGSTAESRNNHAVAAFTQWGKPSNQNPGKDKLVLKTLDRPIAVTSPGTGSSHRFLTGAIDAAELSCDWSLGLNPNRAPGPNTNAKLRFSIEVDGNEKAITPDTIQPCTDSVSRYFDSPAGSGTGSGGSYIAAGSYFAPAALLFDASTATNANVLVYNDETSGDGNDFAFDRVRLYDVTPKLGKAFAPAQLNVGEASTLTFTIANTSDLGRKAGWEFTDTFPAGLTVANSPAVGGTCVADVDAAAGGSSVTVTNGVLENGTASCTITVPVTSATAGSYTNGAANISTIVGLDNPSDTTVVFEPEVKPSIEIVKDGALASGADSVAGSVVNYTFTVTNTGDTTLNNVAISDPLTGLSVIEFGLWPGAPNVLQPDESVTATARYVLTQKDVDAGKVDNTATATGISPDDETVSDQDDATVVLTPRPAITLDKTGAFRAAAVAGELVDYTFEITNTGNVTLTGVTVTDPLPGLSSVIISDWPAAAGTLLPGESATGSAQYTVTAADVDRGSIVNTATAKGTPPSGAAVTDDDSETLNIAATAAIQLEKEGARVATGAARVGETITYNFTITNTGPVTLRDVTLTDKLPGLSAITYGTWPATKGVLAPGASVTASATLTVTQAHIDAGAVENTATAQATSRSGNVSDTDDARVVLAQEAVIELEKLGVLPQNDPLAAGDVVNYTFTVTNTGNVTLTKVAVTDQLPGLSTISYDWKGAAGTLAPSESVVATAKYALKQSDLDRGSLNNVADVAGQTPQGGTVTDTDEFGGPLPTVPAISVEKTGAFATADAIAAGTGVVYDFTVTNTGNVTLSGVSLVDELPGLSAISFGTWPGKAGVLAPGQVVTASATYSLTQGDVDAGAVPNTVVVTGVPATGDDPVTDDDDFELVVPDGSAIQIVKSGELASDAATGENVVYTFTVSNIGNTTLTGVTIADELPGLSELEYGEWPTDEGVLAPGESVTATATLTLSQQHVDAGSVANTATTTGTTPSGDTVSDDDNATVVVPPAVSIHLTKKAALNDKATGAVGDVVRYSFVVTNTGNVTLDDVVINDKLAGLGTITYEWPGDAGVLAPGELVRATADYRLTAQDVARGSVTNDATALGQPPAGDPVSDNATVTTALPKVPAALPNTGSALIAPAALSMLLLAGGIVLLVLRRRKVNA